MEAFTEELRSTNDIHPIKLLQAKALEIANLSYDRAFAIDESDIAIKVGEYYITLLVEKFYRKIYDDQEDWFRSIFTSPIEESNQNLADFLIQRIGGTPYYSERKGFPALIDRHAMFNISEDSAERWLGYMNESLNEMEDDIDEKYRRELSDFLRYTAYFLVVAQKSKTIMENMGPGS
mmetsp:Transcript_22279/g.32005  ORF Transcript_22279/g.32005 Transcript_22279/m.32005 type:complete len:178 (+) Transcript_22279:25-558(+)